MRGSEGTKEKKKDKDARMHACMSLCMVRMYMYVQSWKEDLFRGVVAVHT